MIHFLIQSSWVVLEIRLGYLLIPKSVYPTINMALCLIWVSACKNFREYKWIFNWLFKSLQSVYF